MSILLWDAHQRRRRGKGSARHLRTVVRQTCLDLSVGRLLRPTGGRVFKVLLPPIGCRVEEAIGICERFAPARVDRVGMENVVVEAEEDA